MAEQESSGFTVVDKRSAASEANVAHTSASLRSAATPDVAETITPDAHSVGEDAPETALDSVSQLEEAEEIGVSDDQMPDPALLLSMIGIQMETRSLASALITIFDGHAWRNMGLIANPVTSEVKKDMPSAQLAIDCVQFLLSKVESGLPESERRDAQRRLNDLRMNYVAKLREP